MTRDCAQLSAETTERRRGGGGPGTGGGGHAIPSEVKVESELQIPVGIVGLFLFLRTSAPDIADFASAESAEETGLRSEPPVAETYTFHCVSGVN